ncbi:MAG: hypothetical protein K0B10_09850 [Vicingaceae bacterium]|nr:hypothetical protein [Vicingaceae bacterium]
MYKKTLLLTMLFMVAVVHAQAISNRHCEWSATQRSNLPIEEQIASGYPPTLPMPNHRNDEQKRKTMKKTLLLTMLFMVAVVHT